MGYAFISYSTKNQSEADAWRDFLNKNGVQTWMAPGDIPPGFQYPQVINQAVKGCSCFILLLSKYSQESDWVSRETVGAASLKKTIIPIQLEDLVLNDQFSFIIGSSQVVVVKKIDGDSEEVKKALKSIKLCCEYDLDNSSSSNGIDSDEVSRDKDEKVPVRYKSKVVAGLAYLLSFGLAGDFYLGYFKRLIIKMFMIIPFLVFDSIEDIFHHYGLLFDGPYLGIILIISIIGLAAEIVWSVVDGIMSFMGKKTDAKGRALK